MHHNHTKTTVEEPTMGAFSSSPSVSPSLFDSDLSPLDSDLESPSGSVFKNSDSKESLATSSLSTSSSSSSSSLTSIDSIVSTLSSHKRYNPSYGRMTRDCLLKIIRSTFQGLICTHPPSIMAIMMIHPHAVSNEAKHSSPLVCNLNCAHSIWCTNVGVLQSQQVRFNHDVRFKYHMTHGTPQLIHQTISLSTAMSSSQSPSSLSSTSSNHFLSFQHPSFQCVNILTVPIGCIRIDFWCFTKIGYDRYHFKSGRNTPIMNDCLHYTIHLQGIDEGKFIKDRRGHKLLFVSQQLNSEDVPIVEMNPNERLELQLCRCCHLPISIETWEEMGNNFNDCFQWPISL